MPDGYIKDKSALKMLENLTPRRCVVRLPRPDDVGWRSDDILRHLEDVLALGKSHVAGRMEQAATQISPDGRRGIRGLGDVMVSMTEGNSIEELNVADLATRIKALDEVCAWTSGGWHWRLAIDASNCAAA